MNKINILLLVFSVTLIAIYFLIDERKASINLEEKLDKKIIVNGLDLEEYIIGVVAAEMPASFEEEALKSQAVAARSYAIYKINKGDRLTNNTNTQSFINVDEMHLKWKDNFSYYYNKIKTAVNDTKGYVLKYNEEVISAFYFAISNGKTADSSYVFSQDLKYINSVESSWDKNVKNYEVIKEFEKDDFCTKLNLNCGGIKISNVKRNAIGQVEKICINGTNFYGYEIRNKLTLRSTDFDIDIDNKINIKTRGYGHGVGMSQYGANEMAKLGYKYDEILNHYYTDIEIVKI